MTDEPSTPGNDSQESGGAGEPDEPAESVRSAGAGEPGIGFTIASEQDIRDNLGVGLDEAESLKTRATLIERLKNWQDTTSWQEFFDTYWKLIYGVARKAGLSDDEAQDVVQETLIAVSRHIPDFKYDAALGSFKAWMLNMTRWRIVDQMRKRGPVRLQNAPHDTGEPTTDVLQAIPDPASLVPEEIWQLDWQRNLVEAALARLRLSVDPQKYQLFDFYVNKDWPAEKVAERFGVNIDQVYLAKHRLTGLLKEEIRRLETHAI